MNPIYPTISVKNESPSYKWVDLSPIGWSFDLPTEYISDDEAQEMKDKVAQFKKRFDEDLDRRHFEFFEKEKEV